MKPFLRDDVEAGGEKSSELVTLSSSDTKDDVDDDDDDTTTTTQRDQWASKADFILTAIGFCVGLGNVWRFPYLCYKNGGGAFLVPYVIFAVTSALPLYILEVALGQFTRQGAVRAWKICPVFTGIGLASIVIMALLNIYYIVLFAWSIAYLYHSFSSPLPWSHCDNAWNTPRCRVSFDQNVTCDLTLGARNVSECVNETTTTTTWGGPVDPAVEFWERKILEISSGVDEPDGLVWPLAVSLLLAWMGCYFCVWKGIRLTGKIVYVTATAPYVILTILLIRGVTLDGAAQGMLYYVTPNFSRLADIQTWVDAGTQIFFSYALAEGVTITIGSYNSLHNNCYRDCMLIALVNSGTSLFAGFVVFSVLGFMAHEQGVPVSEVAESGPGLAFIAYPKAVTQMPLPGLWAVLFFVTILMLGVDGQFGGLESVITVFKDQFPGLNRGRRRELFIAGYALVSYLLGPSMVTRGGVYVFQLFDYYVASGMALLWVCFFECVAVAWVYGGARFYGDIEMMIGYRINPWLRICWTYVTPVVCLGLFVFMWVDFKPLTYNRTYHYPGWAQALGLCLAFSSMICVPLYVIGALLVTPGSLTQRWRRVTTPVILPFQSGPGTGHDPKIDLYNSPLTKEAGDSTTYSITL